MFIYGLPPQLREYYGLLFTSIMDQLNHPHIMCLAEKCDVYRARLSNPEIYHSFLLTGTMSELPPFLHTAPSSHKHLPCQNGSRGHFGTYLFYAAPRLRCSYPESGEEGASVPSSPLPRGFFWPLRPHIMELWLGLSFGLSG
jgi:hypothetical protein